MYDKYLTNSETQGKWKYFARILLYKNTVRPDVKMFFKIFGFYLGVFE